MYQDHAVTDVACQGLHGMKMGEKTLTVRRATGAGGGAAGATNASGLAGGAGGAPAAATATAGPGAGGVDQAAMYAQVQAHLAGAAAANAAAPPPPSNPPSRVLSLNDMLDVEDLRDDVEYGEITEDMREECGKHGVVLEVRIPRPAAAGGDEIVPGLGKVFVQYEEVAGAEAARKALHGRKFGGQIVVADFVDEAAFAEGRYS